MKKRSAGFSILEAAVVVAIGGIMIAAGTDLLLSYMQQVRINTTQARMKAIDEALGQYLISNGSYPCPASLTAPVDTAAYGTQVTNDCFGAALAAGTFRANSPGPGPLHNGRIRIGAVPTRTLNLSDQFMNDAWNDRIVYAVTEALASPGNVSATPLYDPNKGSIKVIDSGGFDVATPASTAHYVIISHGQNRVGAYTAEGVVHSACSTGTLESNNCQHTVGTFRRTQLNAINVGANTYDDYLIFHTTAVEGIVPTGATLPFYNQTLCPAGWTSPTAPQLVLLPPLGTGTPGYIYCQKQ